MKILDHFFCTTVDIVFQVSLDSSHIHRLFDNLMVVLGRHCENISHRISSNMKLQMLYRDSNAYTPEDSVLQRRRARGKAKRTDASIVPLQRFSGYTAVGS